MGVVTVNDLVAEVRKVASAEPDFRYRDNKTMGMYCSYFGRAVGDLTGSPCIIGKAMANLEVDTSKLLRMESTGANTSVDDIFLEELVGILVDEAEDFPLTVWLGHVQSYQDSGTSWSEAVRKADLDFDRYLG